jgi:hypothetical protein
LTVSPLSNSPLSNSPLSSSAVSSEEPEVVTGAGGQRG